MSRPHPRLTVATTPTPVSRRATAELSVTPVTVTDRTAPAVLGLEPRVYREYVIRHGVRHTMIGRRMVCRVSDVLDALDRAAVDGATTAAETVDEDAPSNVDALLERIGRRRTA